MKRAIESDKQDDIASASSPTQGTPSPSTPSPSVKGVLSYPNVVITHANFPSPQNKVIIVQMNNIGVVSAPMSNVGYTTINILGVVQRMAEVCVFDVVPNITCHFSIVDEKRRIFAKGDISMDLSERLSTNGTISSFMNASFDFNFPDLTITHTPLFTPTSIQIQLDGSPTPVFYPLCTTGITVICLLEQLECMPALNFTKGRTNASFQILVAKSVVSCGLIALELPGMPVIGVQYGTRFLLEMAPHDIIYSVTIASPDIGLFTTDACFSSGNWIFDIDCFLEGCCRPLCLPAILTLTFFRPSRAGPKLVYSKFLTCDIAQISIEATAIFAKLLDPETEDYRYQLKAIRITWGPLTEANAPRSLFFSIIDSAGAELTTPVNHKLPSACANVWGIDIPLSDQPMLRFQDEINQALNYRVTVYSKIGAYTSPGPGTSLFKVAATQNFQTIVPL